MERIRRSSGAKARVMNLGRGMGDVALKCRGSPMLLHALSINLFSNMASVLLASRLVKWLGAKRLE